MLVFLGQGSSNSGISCLMIWRGADVIIIIEINCTKNVVHFNHSQTISPTPVHGKIVFHEIGPWCQKVGDCCSGLFHWHFSWSSGGLNKLNNEILYFLNGFLKKNSEISKLNMNLLWTWNLGSTRELTNFLWCEYSEKKILGPDHTALGEAKSWILVWWYYCFPKTISYHLPNCLRHHSL